MSICPSSFKVDFLMAGIASVHLSDLSCLVKCLVKSSWTEGKEKGEKGGKEGKEGRERRGEQRMNTVSKIIHSLPLPATRWVELLG